MNLDLCKNCHLKPYLMIYDFSKANKKIIMKQIIACTESMKSIIAYDTAELSNETLNRIEQHLTCNGYKTDGYTTTTSSRTFISLLDNIKDKSILKDVEINKQCPYYVEHEMDFFNPGVK